jgi:hypothetical protein
MLLLSQLFRFSGRLLYAGSWVSHTTPGVCLTAARQAGPKGPPPAGHAERGGAQ